MKVGLSIVYEGNNYGMLLQAYATQYLIDNMGYETEIIGYRRKGLKGIRLSPGLLIDCLVLLNKRVKKKLAKEEVLDEIHKMNLEQRKSEAKRFARERLHDIHVCYGYDELVESAKKYNAVIVGSDQLWLPECVFGILRTLRFVPDNVKKISYATSLGVSKYPFYCRESARQFLRRFDCISVREEQGKAIINSLCDKEVSVVLDPTYMLTKRQWEHLLPNEREIHLPYVLFYFIGNNEMSKETAIKFAKDTGLYSVSILSDESYSDIDMSYADQIIVGAGPERFVNLIRNAEYVLTDSFHGIAFSIINQKDFYAFYRYSSESSNSRNSRIDNILSTWKLEDRLAVSAFSENIAPTGIDYTKVDEILEQKRRESMLFLERAFHE